MQRLALLLFYELEVVELAEGFVGGGGVEDEEEGVLALDALETGDIDRPFRLPTRGVGGEGNFAEDDSSALGVGVVEHDGDGTVDAFGHEIHAEAGMRHIGGVGEVEVLIADDGAAGVVDHGAIGNLLIVGALLGLLAEARGFDVRTGVEEVGKTLAHRARFGQIARPSRRAFVERIEALGHEAFGVVF